MDEGISVLYVGPDETVGDRLATDLERRTEPVEIEAVRNVTEAIDTLERGRVDCLVSAHEIGGEAEAQIETGIDLLATVRETFPTLPFVLFSAVCSPMIVREATEAGVTAFVPRETERSDTDLLADRLIEAVQDRRTLDRAEEFGRINAVIRDLNRGLVGAETAAEIDRRVCEIISEAEPYRFAWIGGHDPDSGRVEPRAASGIEEGYLEAIEITTDTDDPHSQGPTGNAVRTREMQIMQNIPEDPDYEPWREDALERGYRSSAAVPLVYEGTLYGVLNVYADRTNAFDAEERQLLEELGETIAHAHHDVELHRKARRFQRAVEQAADAIFITDTDGTIEYVNPAFEELTGYAFSEVVGETPRVLKSGEMDDAYYEKMWMTILDGEIWESEIVNARRSGERYYAEQTIAPITGGPVGAAGGSERSDGGVDADDIEGFVAIQRDVTDRKERERALRRSKERLRILFDKAPDGIVIHDTDGTVLDTNETLVDRLGYSHEELLSMSVLDFEVGAEENRLREQWHSMSPGSMHKADIEGTHRRKDGSTYPVEVWISKVTLGDPDGSKENPDGKSDADPEATAEERLIAIVRDITERKERQRELRERKNRYQTVVENTHDGLVIVQDGEIRYVNPQIAEITGYEPEDVIGEPATRFLTEEYESMVLERYRDRRQEIDVPDTYDVEIRSKAGEPVPVELRVETFEYDGEPATITAVRDISERTDRLRQLRVLDRVLRHNLRNDMTTIQGYAETIETETDDDGVAADARRIVEQSRTLMETIEKERTIVEVIGERPDRRETDVADVCERAASDLLEGHPDAEIDLERPEGGATATATKHLGRAIEELLENAVVHSDRERPRVSVSVERRPKTTRIEIADDGPGIPEREVKVLTREYEIEPLYHGSGLGLWLVNWIVRRSGGTLAFEESEPRGSVVTIDLPRREA